jgi:hypothetical protein
VHLALVSVAVAAAVALTACGTRSSGAGGDLGFTTTSEGVAVNGPVYGNGNPYGLPGQLLLTSDAGTSWTAVRF